jgi:hypothetical protein
MPPDNLYAYTAPGADMPEFVSVNKADGGGIDIVVRSPKEFGSATAQIALNRDQTRALYHALQIHLTPNAA